MFCEVVFGEDEFGEEKGGDLVEFFERKDAEDLDVGDTGDDKGMLAVGLVDLGHERIELEGNFFGRGSGERLVGGTVFDG